MTRERFSRKSRPAVTLTILFGLVLFGHLACSKEMPKGEPEGSSVAAEPSREAESEAADLVVDSTLDGEQACGGIAGIPCPKGELCELPAGSCQGADLDGVCVERPEVCPEIYDPVCGCDSRTYSNDCFRLMAGVLLDYDGECEMAASG